MRPWYSELQLTIAEDVKNEFEVQEGEDINTLK
jgi:hypothetical protein